MQSRSAVVSESLVSEIDNRMPVILDPDDYEA